MSLQLDMFARDLTYRLSRETKQLKFEPINYAVIKDRHIYLALHTTLPHSPHYCVVEARMELNDDVPDEAPAEFVPVLYDIVEGIEVAQPEALALLCTADEWRGYKEILGGKKV